MAAASRPLVPVTTGVDTSSAPVKGGFSATSSSHGTPTYLFTPAYNQNFQYFDLPKEIQPSQLQSIYIPLTDKFKELLIQHKQKLLEAVHRLKPHKSLNNSTRSALPGHIIPFSFLHTTAVMIDMTQYFYELCMCVVNGSILPHRAAEFIMKRLHPLCRRYLQDLQEEFTSTLSEDDKCSRLPVSSGVDSVTPGDVNSELQPPNHQENPISVPQRDEASSGNMESGPTDGTKHMDTSRDPLDSNTLYHKSTMASIESSERTHKISSDADGPVHSPSIGLNRFLSSISLKSFQSSTALSGAGLLSPFKDMLLDSVWLIVELLDNLPSSSAQSVRSQTNMNAFFLALEREQAVLKSDIIAFIDPAKLDSMRCVKLDSKGGLQGMNIKERTKRLYTLSTHNLMREHTTGYAKLQTCLQEFVVTHSKMDIRSCRRIVCEIVGNFSLCPSRTLGIMLGVYEGNLTAKNQLLSLISMFSRDKITEVICFQLNLFTQLLVMKGQEDDKAAMSNTIKPSYQSFWLQNLSGSISEPSDNFYKLAAVLLMHELLDFKSLYSFLEPADALLQELFAQLEKKYTRDVEDIRSGKPIPQSKINLSSNLSSYSRTTPAALPGEINPADI
ncbi:hypothetical protein IE077_002190, partial [Cardiosporidium cionae]